MMDAIQIVRDTYDFRVFLYFIVVEIFQPWERRKRCNCMHLEGRKAIGGVWCGQIQIGYPEMMNGYKTARIHKKMLYKLSLDVAKMLGLQ